MADERRHEQIDCSRIYVTYSVEHHADGIDGEGIDTATHGGTHDVLIAAVMHGQDGSSSTALLGINALGGDLSPEDRFRVWTLMAKELADTLPTGSRQELASMVFEAVRAAVVGGRGQNGR